MNSLQLNPVLTGKNLSRLKGARLDDTHFASLYNESISITGEDGAMVAVLLKGAIPMQVATDVLPYLLDVERVGTLSNRSSVVGAGSQMNRIRKKDGQLGGFKVVHDNVLKAHGGKGGNIGYLEGKGNSYCRETGWTQERPDILQACGPLLGHVNKAYRLTLPEQYARQMVKVDLISPHLKLGGTAFTTITVNLNNRTRAHTDKGDVKDGMGLLTTHGNFAGGFFIMPKYGIAFDVQPGDLLLADVHQLHANAEMFGQRVSCVFYAREKMHLCPS